MVLSWGRPHCIGQRPPAVESEGLGFKSHRAYVPQEILAGDPEQGTHLSPL